MQNNQMIINQIHTKFSIKKNYLVFANKFYS